MDSGAAAVRHQAEDFEGIEDEMMTVDEIGNDGGRAGHVSVRRADPDEYEAVGELTVAAYRADGLLRGADGSADHYAPVLRDTATRDAQAEVWVAVDDHDALLGTVTWCPPGSPYREIAHSPDEAEFRMLAVPPALRRRGAARALVLACISRARAEGMRAVLLSSLPQMTAAHGLYRDLGFLRAPDLDHHPIPLVDLWAFQLSLTSPAPIESRSVQSRHSPGLESHP